MKLLALIVHLRRADERRPQVERIRQSLPMPVEVLDAVDGHALTPSIVTEIYRPDLFRPRYPFVLRPAEIGCFLSHRAAWRRIVESGAEAGLVIEDDVEVETALFPAALELAMAEIGLNDFVRFAQKGKEEGGLPVAAGGGCDIVLPRLPGLGMQCQIVGRDAAAKLLERTARFDRPVDTFLQMHWVHGVRILSLRPGLVRDIGRLLGGSLVQPRGRSWRERLAREIRRPIYRLLVRAHALMRARS